MWIFDRLPTELLDALSFRSARLKGCYPLRSLTQGGKPLWDTPNRSFTISPVEDFINYGIADYETIKLQ